MNPGSFFAELKRRKVYKVAVAYAAVGWLLIQVATTVFPVFQIPSWAMRLVIVLVLLGFPLSLVLAWAYEATPDGIRRAPSGGVKYPDLIQLMETRSAAAHAFSQPGESKTC